MTTSYQNSFQTFDEKRLAGLSLMAVGHDEFILLQTAIISIGTRKAVLTKRQCKRVLR